MSDVLAVLLVSRGQTIPLVVDLGGGSFGIWNGRYWQTTTSPETARKAAVRTIRDCLDQPPKSTA